jgi:hypothetical protein
MEFGPDHYTRDWDLLAGVAGEWATIRARFKLGSKATREQIEEHWDEIFKANSTDWPCIRRVHVELMQDPALQRHLTTCYWKRLEDSERKGYKFKQVLPGVLRRIFLTVVRNAHQWLKHRATLEHWARFWNTKNLTKELGREIDYMDEKEGSLGVQLRAGSEDDEPEQSPEPVRDYQGKRQEQPEEVVELKDRMLAYCHSRQERELIADWFDNAREDPDKEPEVLDRHPPVTKDDLHLLLRRIGQRIRNENKQ